MHHKNDDIFGISMGILAIPSFTLQLAYAFAPLCDSIQLLCSGNTIFFFNYVRINITKEKRKCFCKYNSAFFAGLNNKQQKILYSTEGIMQTYMTDEGVGDATHSYMLFCVCLCAEVGGIILSNIH